jgi:hypothetical protein
LGRKIDQRRKSRRKGIKKRRTRRNKDGDNSEEKIMKQTKINKLHQNSKRKSFYNESEAKTYFQIETK